MEFNGLLSSLQNWAENWPKERTDDMSELAKEAIRKGWYLNEALLFTLYCDLDDYGLSEFLLHVWIFYVKLLDASQSFINKSEFLEAIDDHKLG